MSEETEMPDEIIAFEEREWLPYEAGDLYGEPFPTHYVRKNLHQSAIEKAVEALDNAICWWDDSKRDGPTMQTIIKQMLEALIALRAIAGKEQQ